MSFIKMFTYCDEYGHNLFHYCWPCHKEAIYLRFKNSLSTLFISIMCFQQAIIIERKYVHVHINVGSPESQKKTVNCIGRVIIVKFDPCI